MAKPFDLAVGEWWKSTVQTGSKISDVFVSPAPTGTQATITASWGAAAYDSSRDDIIIFGGGHTDYSGNEAYAFSVDPLSGNFLKWRVKWKNSTTRTASEDYADGSPSSAHTYCAWIYDPNRDKLVRMPGVGIYDAGTFTLRTYDIPASTESPSTAVGSSWVHKADALIDADGVAAYDPTSNKMFSMHSGGGSEQGIRSFNGTANTWTTHTTFDSGAAANPHNMTAAICPLGVGYMAYMGGSLQMKKLSDFTFAGTSDATYGATGDTAIETPAAPGFIWDDVASQFVAWAGLLASGTDRRDYYTLPSPAGGSKVWTRHIGTGDIPPAPVTNGTYSRFVYCGGGLCALVNDTATEVYFFRSSIVPSTTQSGYRIRNDDGSETTATWQAAENTDVTLAQGTPIRVRFTMDTDTNDLASTQFQLEQQLQIPLGAWTAVPTSAPSSGFMIWPSANIAPSGVATTRQMATPSGKTTGQFTAGQLVDDSNPSPAVNPAVNEWTELEYSIRPVVNRRIAVTEQWKLRITANGVALDAYDQTPTLSVSGLGTGFLARKAT